jgi:hypothetical protein
MARRQSNNEWCSGIAAQPAPKKFGGQKSTENFSPRLSFLFGGNKTASSPLILFQSAKLPTRRITYLCRCNLKIFWSKNATGNSTCGSCSCRTMSGLMGTCTPEETGLPLFPVSWSPYLFSGSGPLRLPPYTRIKKQFKFAIFLLTRMSLLPRRPGWTDNFLKYFFEWLRKVRAPGLELRWASWAKCCINPRFGCCSLVSSWSG